MLSCRSGTCWNKSNPRRLRRVRAQLVAMLVANCCESSWHPWIVVVAARPTDAQLDWDLGNLEARSTPRGVCHIPQAIPEAFLICCGAHCPSVGGL